MSGRPAPACGERRRPARRRYRPPTAAAPRRLRRFSGSDPWHPPASDRPKASAMRRLLLITLAASLLPAGAATGVATPNTSHDGWPPITGGLLMNKTDSARPLDAPPRRAPFAGPAPAYSCDAVHKRGSCQRRFVRSGGAVVMTSRAGHNELLGGHGGDTIYAGPWGDVLWGDYKPSGQNATQRDSLVGGS